MNKATFAVLAAIMVSTTIVLVESAVPDDCLLPAVQGFCKGLFWKYFYNADTQACEKFMYGGCGGNDNNFDTIDACQNACQSV